MKIFLNYQVSPFFLSTEAASFSAAPSLALDPANSEIPSAQDVIPDIDLARLVDGGKLFAAGEGPSGAAGGIPPPPGDAPSGGGGSGSGSVGFSMIPTLNTVEHDRLYNMKMMASAGQITSSMAIDLASIDGDLEQLEYLMSVMGTLDEFSRSGSRIAASELVGVVDLAANAANEITPMITPKTTGGFSGMETVSLLMRRITSVADNLEQSIIGGGTMDREKAGRLAVIYSIAAVKGSAADALGERLSSGINNPVYKAHVSKALMQLIDVMERYERLGKPESVAEVRKVITQFNVYHGLVTGSRKWALDTAVDFLRSNIRHIYAEIEFDPSVRGAMPEASRSGGWLERHAIFMHNLRFFIQGNRRHAPSILFNVQGAFAEEGDDVMMRRFNGWAVREMQLSDALSRI